MSTEPEVILHDKENIALNFSAFFSFRNVLRSTLLGFEVCDDVFFSQSGYDCPVIFCPRIPNPTVSRKTD